MDVKNGERRKERRVIFRTNIQQKSTLDSIYKVKKGNDLRFNFS